MRDFLLFFCSISEMKSYLLSEVDFISFYAQNERKLSESDLSKMVRGVGFEPTNPYGIGASGLRL